MKKNVIVILMDTARASDVYDNSSLSTLADISRKATKYECAVSPATWTAPAHAALFTNKKVSEIKHVSKNFLSNGTYKMEPWMVKTKFLEKKANTVAKKISMYGYQSVLMSNNPFLTSYTNLALGFQKVHDIWLYSNVKYNKSFAKRFNFILDGGVESFAKMMDVGYLTTRWMPKTMMDNVYLTLRKKMVRSTSNVDGTHMMDRGANDTIKLLGDHFTYNYNYKPQFMFINYMEAHENYSIGDIKVPQDKWLYLSGLEDMSDYNMKQLHKAYLKRLKYLDNKVKATIAVLKDNGILENATVIITSDHGQFFGEHKMLYHSMPPYEEVSRVPLIAANYKNGKLVRIGDSVDTPVSILYVGGDYCPYCAITRWGMVLTLMRFGNFTSLHYMESSSKDVNPNTATFTFTGYGYNSNLVSFEAFEIYDRNMQNITIANFTQKDQFLISRYSEGGIPFIDFANSSIQGGAVISPQVIQGENWNQVLADLSNQNSVVSQEIIGNANIFTAYICASNQTLNATALACRQPYVKKVLG